MAAIGQSGSLRDLEACPERARAVAAAIAELEGLEQVRRQQTLVKAFKFLLVLVPVYLLIYLAIGNYYAVAGAAAAWGTMVYLMGQIRSGASMAWVSNVTCCAAFWTVVVIVFSMGGTDSAVVIWLALCPIFAFSLGSLRAGLFWSVLSVATIVAAYSLGWKGTDPPDMSTTLRTLYEALVVVGFLVSACTMVVAREHLLFGGFKIDALHRSVAQAQITAVERDRAQAASVAKSRFMSVMSHELRTPLNHIIGLASLVPTERLNEADEDLLLHIQESGSHLLDMVDRILDYTVVDERPVRPKPCVVADLAHELFVGLKIAAEAKGLRAHLELQDVPEGPLPIDQQLIVDILNPIVGNALRFTEEGEIRLCFAVRPAAGPAQRSRLHVTIQDTGIGISPERVDSVFEHFTQGDDGASRRFGGIGLGLTMSQRLAGLMGASLAVESELGKGSCFTLDVPLRPVEELAEAA